MLMSSCFNLNFYLEHMLIFLVYLTSNWYLDNFFFCVWRSRLFLNTWYWIWDILLSCWKYKYRAKFLLTIKKVSRVSNHSVCVSHKYSSIRIHETLFILTQSAFTLESSEIKAHNSHLYLNVGMMGQKGEVYDVKKDNFTKHVSSTYLFAVPRQYENEKKFFLSPRFIVKWLCWKWHSRLELLLFQNNPPENSSTFCHISCWHFNLRKSYLHTILARSSLDRNLNLNAFQVLQPRQIQP